MPMQKLFEACWKLPCMSCLCIFLFLRLIATLSKDSEYPIKIKCDMIVSSDRLLLIFSSFYNKAQINLCTVPIGES